MLINQSLVFRTRKGDSHGTRIEKRKHNDAHKHTDLEVKELSELLYIINLSINDYYRANCIHGAQLSRYAPTVQAVRQGSIELDLALGILRDIAVGVAVELFVGYLINRIRILLDRYESGRTRRQIFTYEITSSLEIRIERGIIVIEVNKRTLAVEMNQSM